MSRINELLEELRGISDKDGLVEKSKEEKRNFALEEGSVATKVLLKKFSVINQASDQLRTALMSDFGIKANQQAIAMGYLDFGDSSLRADLTVNIDFWDGGTVDDIMKDLKAIGFLVTNIHHQGHDQGGDAYKIYSFTIIYHW